MKFSQITCIDDLLRESWWPAKQFFYDLIREPINQAVGIDVGMSPRKNFKHNLIQGFDAITFTSLCLSEKDGWESCFFNIPSEAENYLLDYLPQRTLVISYEMPPWLSSCLERANVTYLDLRISPLRFARDLYVAIRSNDAELLQRLQAFTVKEEELRLESALISASVRHLHRYSGEYGHLDNALIFIGQTSEDASLVGPLGQFLRVEKYADTIKEIGKDKSMVLHKPHPSAGSFSIEERKKLSALFGYDVGICDVDIYNLLGSEFDFELIGISSGVLQEAPWFSKKATTLYKHICPLTSGKHTSEHLYRQIHFHQIISPRFWHLLLSPESSPPIMDFLPIIQSNHLRELHNVWWGYSTYMIKNRHFWTELSVSSDQVQEKLKFKKVVSILTRNFFSTMSSVMSRVKGLVSRRHFFPDQ